MSTEEHAVTKVVLLSCFPLQGIPEFVFPQADHSSDVVKLTQNADSQ